MQRIIISMVISLLCVVSSYAQHACQVLDVCVKVNLSKSLRRDAVDIDTRLKYNRFFNIDLSSPFEKHVAVESAYCTDYVCNYEDIELKKDLMRSIPDMIKQDTKISKKDRKNYCFPSAVPSSFIERVEKYAHTGKKLEQIIYTNARKEKTLKLRYTIEYSVESVSQTIPQENIPTVIAACAHSQPHENDSFLSSQFLTDFALILLIWSH